MCSSTITRFSVFPVTNTLVLSTIDDQLQWGHHVEQITSRAHQRLSLLRWSKAYLPRIKFYKTLVQLLLEYTSVAWSSCDQTVLRNLQSIEGYAGHLITDSMIRTRTDPLIKQLRLFRLVDRFAYFRAILTYRCVSGMSPAYLRNVLTSRKEVCHRVTRNTIRLLLRQPRTNYLKRSFCFQGSDLWNQLPKSIIESRTLKSFKYLYKNLILIPSLS